MELVYNEQYIAFCNNDLLFIWRGEGDEDNLK